MVSSATETADPQLIKQGWPHPQTRTIVSLLLFFHLFLALSALFASQAPPGIDMATLKDRLVRRMRFYTQLFNFESFAPLYLTHGTADDVDFRIESRNTDKPADEPRSWQLFQEGWRGTERYARYQRLAALLAYFAAREDEQRTAEIESAVARRLLIAEGQQVANVRSRRHLLQTPNDLRDNTPIALKADDQSFFRELHRAQVLNFGNGDIRVQKVEAKGHVAPPTKGPGR